MRSRTSSSPTDSRISPSPMPTRRRTSGSIDACVIVGGWQKSDRTLPSDSASVQSFTSFANARAASRPPSISKETIAPKRAICRRATVSRSG